MGDKYIKYEISLEWVDIQNNTHYEVMDDSLKSHSAETYDEIVSSCEKCLDHLLEEYGEKEWLFFYTSYQKVELRINGKLTRYWTIGKYLRERRKI